ncbi:MAG TPA: polysaccharide biosynthesis tyrosine autokinase [Chloroflexota bacterium]
MNFGLYLYQIRRWVLFAIAPALLVIVATYLYEHHLPKQYQTSALLYVQVPGDQSQPGSTDIYTSQALIPTYAQMITSPVVTQAVDRDLAKLYPRYAIESHGLKVAGLGSTPSAPVNTQLMTITVTDSIPSRAAAAANTAANEFINQITTIQKTRYKGGAKAIQRQISIENNNIQLVSQQIQNYKGNPEGLQNLKAQLSAYQSIYQTLIGSEQEFALAKNTALNGVKVFSPAQIPTGAVGPHPIRTAALAGFITLLICLGLIFLYDYFDDTPRTPEEIEEVVGAPILGTVQQFDESQYGTQLVTARHSRSPVSEAYRVIRTNIQFTDVDHPPRVLVVTSASPAEGKSTTVSNLANVFAEAGSRVILVDGDLRRPSLHRVFEVGRGEGLTNMLVSNDELNGHGTKQTERPNLELIASGPLPPRPADLLGSSRMRDLAKHLGHQSEMVLIDSPPILAVTDAAILSTVADGVILVVDPGRSKKRDLKRAREAVETVGGRILGVVVNRLNRRGSSYYYYYYHHNYGYQYNYQYQYLARPDSPDKQKQDGAAGGNESGGRRHALPVGNVNDSPDR